MPSNWLSIDTGFPTFRGDESPKEQVKALHDYMYQLREGLQYSLQNLTAENFNKAAWEKMTTEQKNEVTLEMKKVYNQLSEISQTVASMSAQVSGLLRLSGTVKELSKQTEDNAEGIRKNTGRIETAEKNLREVTEYLKGLDGIFQIGEDGTVTIGAEGRTIHIRGSVFINDVPQGTGGVNEAATNEV